MPKPNAIGPTGAIRIFNQPIIDEVDAGPGPSAIPHSSFKPIPPAKRTNPSPTVSTDLPSRRSSKVRKQGNLSSTILEEEPHREVRNGKKTESQSRVVRCEGVKRSRSRNGCLVCRARRIKCDIGKPECARCVTYGAECVYPLKKAFDHISIDAALAKRHKKPSTIAARAIGLNFDPPSSSSSLAHPPSPDSPLSSILTTVSTSALALKNLTPTSQPSSTSRDNLAISQPSIDGVTITKTAIHKSENDDDRQVKSSAQEDPKKSSSRRGVRVGVKSSNVQILTQTQMEHVHALFRQTRMGGFFANPIEPPEFLRVAFPIDQDLKCFHHCLTYTLSILTVNEDHNPWIRYIAPLFLFPTGAAPISTEALKYSMLAIGATHLGYLQARTRFAPEAESAEETMITARQYRDKAIGFLRQARDIPEELSHSSFLSACGMLLNNDVLSANLGWREPLRYARKAVQHRGGCGHLLFGDAYAVTGYVPGSILPSPSPLDRYTIEHLVMLEIIAALSSGSTVTILCGDSRWWDELGRTSSSERDWESIEATFGVHRDLLRLAIDVTTLMRDMTQFRTTYGQASLDSALSVSLPSLSTDPNLSTGISATLATHSTFTQFDPSLTGSLERTSIYPCPLTSSSAITTSGSTLTSVEALSLLARTEFLESALVQWRGESGTRTMDTRTQIGSFALWHALRLLVLRELRMRERRDAECQSSAAAILELCVEVGDKVEYMNWPLIIACSVLIDEDLRQRARDVLKTFAYQCCNEVEVIQIIVEEIWRRVDEGYDDIGCDWKEVAIELGYPVLLG